MIRTSLIGILTAMSLTPVIAQEMKIYPVEKLRSFWVALEYANTNEEVKQNLAKLEISLPAIFSGVVPDSFVQVLKVDSISDIEGVGLIHSVLAAIYFPDGNKKFVMLRKRSIDANGGVPSKEVKEDTI